MPPEQETHERARDCGTYTSVRVRLKLRCIAPDVIPGGPRADKDVHLDLNARVTVYAAPSVTPWTSPLCVPHSVDPQVPQKQSPHLGADS